MSVRGLLTRFLDGEVTFEHLMNCIRQKEGLLHCWAQLKPEDEQVFHEPLKGLPYGLKDIFDARGYQTTYGSELYSTNTSTTDASLVSLLRRRGARLMGKTHTTAFAYYDPGPTRNPRQPLHTPGGSSSGSAAAVAAGMVPLAVGTQTQGSVIRPASFCGVVGFKPTYGLISLDGAMPFAPSLDTVGFFAQTAVDLRIFWRALGFSGDALVPSSFALVEFDVEPEMQAAIRYAIQTLGALGHRIKRIMVPESFRRVFDAVSVINRYEGAQAQKERFRLHGPAIGAKLAQLVQDGLDTPEERYSEAIAAVHVARREMSELFESFPVILSAAAPGPAPRGLAFTGDPRCNAPWTALGVPVITIPMGVPEGMLPMGLQMAAAPNQDALLLATASHFHALMSAAPGEPDA